jgi:hypothetical protein
MPQSMWFAPSPAPRSGADLPSNVPVDHAEVTPAPEMNALDPNTAAVQLPTGLKLDEAQEAAMVQRALDRISELKTEMGLQDGGRCQVEGWMWEREKNQKQYDNDWLWRAALGGIFVHSNFSLNTAKRFARLMAAKTTDDLIGTDPFFACMPTQHGDPETAKEAEWYLQEQVSQSNAKESIADAEKIALIRNESVVKSSYVTRRTRFRGPATVATGPFMYQASGGNHFTPAGEPVMTPKGQYIYEKDDVIPDPNVQGLMRLQKEPDVAFRHAFEFQQFPNLDQWLIPNCADCYMRADVDGDGIEEEVWLIIDRKAKKVIWYDYLGAHLKKRPFEVIVGIEKVPNRWYGVGVFEMLDHKQTYIDTQFNRVNFKSSKNSSVRFRNVGGHAMENRPELVFGDDQVLDIEDPRFTRKTRHSFRSNLTDIDPNAMHLIELMLQAASTEVGIMGPDDGNMAGWRRRSWRPGLKAWSAPATC